jgi:hypothetical protein
MIHQPGKGGSGFDINGGKTPHSAKPFRINLKSEFSISLHRVLGKIHLLRKGNLLAPANRAA